MKVGTVTQKFIVSQMRLDGKFHLSDGLKVRALINKSPYGLMSIKDVCSDIYCPGIFKRHYVKSGTAFLGGGDIQKSNLDSGKYLRESSTPNYEILQIKKGWTLVTCGGTIGDCAFANNLHAKCWASQHVMRVIPSSIKEGMLYAYLASNYGKLLLCTDTYGSVIPTLNAESIGTLPIPNFPESFQHQVDDLIQESAKLREEATSSLRIAISLFEKENVDYFINNTSSKQKTVSISNIINNHKRLDSTYQLWLSDLSNYNQSVGQRRTCKIQVLANDIFIGNRGKRNYAEQGIPFISSSDMMLFNPIKYAKRIGTKTPNLSSMLVKQGDILISRSGTVGNTALVSNTLLDCAVSEHAMRLRIAEGEITPEYIFCYFNTKEGKRYLENLAYGSVIITLGEEFVGDIDLPILSDDVQKEITKLIKDYSKKIDAAIELENKATSLIELEIEKWNN